MEKDRQRVVAWKKSTAEGENEEIVDFPITASPVGESPQQLHHAEVPQSILLVVVVVMQVNH